MTHADEFPWKKTAVVVMGLFLLGFAVQLGLTVMERRASLEDVVQPSAVEDASLFAIPEGLAEGDVLVTYEGDALVAAALEPEKAASVSMMRVGKEDSGKFDLYVPGGDEEMEEVPMGVYFLKTAPRRFLRVRIQELATE